MTTAKIGTGTARKQKSKKGAESDTLNFDVTSGGFLHVPLRELYDSSAAKRQIEAIEYLSTLQKRKTSK